MDTDVILVVGIVLVALSLPLLLRAFSESDAPRTGVILLAAGVVLFVLAQVRHPSGYSFSEIPDVFVRVIGHYLG